jgi:hypothetical protein
MSAFLRITCCKCHESHRISLENLSTRENVFCFNCQTAMPDRLLQPLKAMASNYLEAQKQTDHDPDVFVSNNNVWGIEIVYGKQSSL